MEPITAGLTIASLAGQIFANIRSGNANDANRLLLKEQQAKNEATFNNTVNRDFLDTNVAKGLFERLRKNLRENNQVIDSNAAATGATAEQVIAQKSKNQENFNDAVNQVAGQATNYQLQQQQLHDNRENSLVNTEMNLNQQEANNAAIAGNNAANLAVAAANLPGTEIASVGTNQFGRTEGQETALRTMGNWAAMNVLKQRQPFRV